MEGIFLLTTGLAENTWGRRSLQLILYKIKVQWKGQIVVFQLCSNVVWRHDDVYFSTLPVEFEIDRVDFRPRETEISLK